jgi:hypothetical protein
LLSLKGVSVKLLVFLAIAGVIILATAIPVETMRLSLFSPGGVR